MATDLSNGYKTKHVYRAPQAPPAPYGSSFIEKAPEAVVPHRVLRLHDTLQTAVPSRLGVRRRKRH